MASKKTRKQNCGIWEEDFFIDVSAHHKLFYLYICDNSTYGVWRPNLKRFEKDNKIKINIPDFLEDINKDRLIVAQLQSHATTIFFLTLYFSENHDSNHQHTLQMINTSGKTCTWCAGFMRSLYNNNIPPSLIESCDNKNDINLDQIFGGHNKPALETVSPLPLPIKDIHNNSTSPKPEKAIIYSSSTSSNEHRILHPGIAQIEQLESGTQKITKQITLKGALAPTIEYTFDGGALSTEFEKFLMTNDWDNVSMALGFKNASSLEKSIREFHKTVYGTNNVQTADQYKKFFFHSMKKIEEKKEPIPAVVNIDRTKKDFKAAYSTGQTNVKNI